jgi:hypothetical protein
MLKRYFSPIIPLFLLLATAVEADNCTCPQGANCCYVTLVIDADINITTLDQQPSSYGLETVCNLPGSSTTLENTLEFILVPISGIQSQAGGVQIAFANSTAGGTTPILNLQMEAGSGNCITQGTRTTTFTPDPLYAQEASLSCAPPNGNRATCSISAVEPEIISP